MSEPYRRKRSFYQDVSGSLNVGAGTDDTTVQASKNNYTIYLQKAHIQITGASAGKTWQFTDVAGVQLTGPFPTDTDGSHYDMDFGPDGVPLTEASGLLLDVSAAGASGWASWEAYLKPTSAFRV